MVTIILPKSDDKPTILNLQLISHIFLKINDK